jgi:anti-anti-sigma regulatory factor
MEGTSGNAIDAGGSGPALHAELHSDGLTCTLTLSGTLCHTSIATLEGHIDELGRASCSDVIVDVQCLATIDPIGAKVLLGLHYYVDGRGGCLRFTGASAEVAQALRKSGAGARIRESDGGSFASSDRG